MILLSCKCSIPHQLSYLYSKLISAVLFYPNRQQEPINEPSRLVQEIVLRLLSEYVMGYTNLAFKYRISSCSFCFTLRGQSSG